MPWGAFTMGRSILWSLGAFALFLTFTTKLQAQIDLENQTDLIYGDDDRVEIQNYNDDRFIEFSKSVAVRVSKRRLTVDRTDETKILFPLVTLERSMPQLCKDERFIDQVSLGTCSGFLVGPKTLVTAGHCMTTEKDCENNKWVFGFTTDSKEFNINQVYSCKKVVHQKNVYDKLEVSDYAVIELDRAVVNAKPLKTRKFGRINLGTPLVVLGHPLGLPMKATDGGVVSRMNDIERENPLRSLWLRNHYFTANLDAYSGNSGSPVFNANTGKVEGILVQGADDFIYNPKKECMQSRKLKDHHLETYEKVMRITKLPKF